MNKKQNYIQVYLDPFPKSQLLSLGERDNWKTFEHQHYDSSVHFLNLMYKPWAEGGIKSWYVFQ